MNQGLTIYTLAQKKKIKAYAVSMLMVMAIGKALIFYKDGYVL